MEESQAEEVPAMKATRAQKKPQALEEPEEFKGIANLREELRPND